MNIPTPVPVPVKVERKVLEKHVEQFTKRYAKSIGWLTFKWSSANMRGVCDDIFIYKGNVIFIEFKRPGGKPTRKQQQHHQLLASHGVTVFVIDSKQLGKEIIDHETTFNKTKRHHASKVRKIDSN